MYELKTYDSVPSWIKDLTSGDTVIIYFPRRKQISQSLVISNYVPKTTEHLAILTVLYKIDAVERVEELLYDNYYTLNYSEDSWNAYNII